MGNDIQKGTIYAQGGVGGAGTVNADNLNAHVDEARIKASFVSGKTLRDPATLSDSIVVEAGGVLYRATFQQVIDLIGNTLKLPVGSIIDFAGSSAPGGYLMCFGQIVLRDTYSELFDVIGDTYGSTDSTNFRLPDLRGRVAAGKDDMGGTAANRLTAAATINGSTLGAAGGAEQHTLTANELFQHTHYVANMLTYTGGTGIASGTGYVFTPQLSEPAGSSYPHDNVQPTVIVNKIIRYQ